jgi:hypothetical protein
MRSILAGLVLATAAAPAVADDKCTKEVADAFAKQAQAPKMRTIMTHPGGEGTVTRTISLVRPNRMHAITEAPHEEAGRIETISIGKWAWGAESDGSWTEHKPNVAKMIELDVAKMAGPQQVGNNFSCLGTAAYEGRDYTAYRADPGKGEDGVELAATIYVDPESGLPAFNIVAPTSGDATARLKQAYSYGDDITVDPPAGFVEPSAKADSTTDAPQKN